MSAGAVAAAYQNKLRELDEVRARARSNQLRAACVFASTAIFIFVFGSLAARRAVPLWYPPLLLPVAAISARKYLSNRTASRRASRLSRYYRRGAARLQGDWPGNGEGGEEFSTTGHLYEKDLNLFGEGSLFELLCTARTEIGRRRLAHWLLQAPHLEETIARQEAIQELKNQTGLREEIALLGKYEFQESKWETFAEWLGSPAASSHGAWRVLALFTSSLLATLVIAGFDRVFPWDRLLFGIAPLVLFHAAFGLARRKKTKAAIESLRLIGSELAVFRQGLVLLGRQTFRSGKLDTLVRRMEGGSAGKAVRKLERLIDALNERNKQWFYGPSLLLLFATQMCMAIDRWKRENHASLADWVDAWAEFEALNALAGYAYEHPEAVFPQFVESGVLFDGEALGHPLLPERACVRNDVKLNAAARLYIVSGSNMTGKSTLLRTIGVNAVLALAGAPVRARSLRLSPFAICASLAIGDSLLNRKSKFLAEVERVRQTVELAGQGRPVLYLIDEIFSGTNSRDRRIAAESVIRALAERGAVGALSTHDLALTEIADLPDLRGLNVHMGCAEGGGPLDFDYLLKPGISRETNALAIARLAGVPV